MGDLSALIFRATVESHLGHIGSSLAVLYGASVIQQKAIRMRQTHHQER